jgi:hypothetical protein
MLVRHWPSGGRHDTSLVVGGFLSRAGWSPEAIHHFVAATLRDVGTREEVADWARSASSSAASLAAGEHVYGLTQLTEVFGAAVAKAIAKIVGYHDHQGGIGQASGGSDADAIEINKNYALILAGDKAVVMKFETISGQDQFRLIQVDSFKRWFANKFVTVGRKPIPIAEYWMRHQERRQYEGIEFAPNGGRPRYYNLWQGFAVAPREGDCSKFLDHVRNNVASGNVDHYNWIIAWFAQIVQQPGVKMGTSLVLKGKQGVGKTIVGQIVGSLFGSHYALVSDPRYITGQFNAHMASLLMLQADEAFWGGDKRAEGKLKDLVTGHRHFLEFKRVDPILMDNFIRLLVTSNQDWVVPAGFDERRFAIFDVGEAQMQNTEYFAAILEQMNNGGREALLHHLLNLDISQENLREVPHTASLLEQIIETTTPEQAWWLDTLTNGELPWGTNEGNSCPKRRLFRRYIQHSRSVQGTRRRAIETKLGMFLTKYVGADLKTEKKNYSTYVRGSKVTKKDGSIRSRH